MLRKTPYLPVTLILAIWLGAFALVRPAAEPAAETPAGVAPVRPVNVLLYFGIYTQWYRLEQALEPERGFSLRTVNARSDGAEFIPSREDASAFNVVVLSNVNHGSLKDAGLAAIDSFVRDGGGLLVLGGPFTYGEGKYGGSLFPSLLPIETPRGFDLKWHKPGLPLTAAGEHAVLRGVDLSARPHVFWIHEARPKSESTILLKAGTRPLLVGGRHGKGRVAAFLGTPLGIPARGKPPFWEWSGWPTLVRNTVLWLAHGRVDADRVP